MKRPLLMLNLGLATALGVLWLLGRVLAQHDAEARRTASTFVTLTAGSAAEHRKAAEVTRVELTFPDASTWTYQRRAEGWRIPQFRDAFALGGALDAIVHGLVEARGTPVGTMPGDAARFGLAAPGLKVRCYDAEGGVVVDGRAGKPAPGPRQDEAYLTAAHRPQILQLQANPAALPGAAPAAGVPPLLDRQMTPLALQRGPIARIEFEGNMQSTLRILTRRDLPPDRQARPDQQPRVEWIGTFTDRGELRVNDRVAAAFVQGIVAAAYDELLAPDATATPFATRLRVSLHYDGGANDELRIGEPDQSGRLLVEHGTTGQRFRIGVATRKAFTPDVGALLAVAPEPPQVRPPGGR